MMLLPLLPVAALPWTTCENGTPLPVYIVYFVVLIRSKVIEFRILKQLKVGYAAFIFMLIGCFEHFDWFSDGAFPAQAYACDASMTDKFAAAFLESRTPWLAASVIYLRFWGIATLLLLVAGMAQQATLSFDFTGRCQERIVFAADANGMQGIASH